MIRQINHTDISAVASIYNHYVEHTTVSYEEALLSNTEMAQRVTDVESAGFPWFVAEDDGEVVGYCYACLWKNRSAYRHTAEITVYLKPDATGKGWGSELYTSLFQALKQQGIKTVIGGIGMPNPGSIALHEKMGLKKVAHFEKVGFKFNQWLDVGYWLGDLQDS